MRRVTLYQEAKEVSAVAQVDMDMAILLAPCSPAPPDRLDGRMGYMSNMSN